MAELEGLVGCFGGPGVLGRQTVGGSLAGALVIGAFRHSYLLVGSQVRGNSLSTSFGLLLGGFYHHSCL